MLAVASLLALGSAAGPVQEAPAVSGVDPLLLAEAAQVWELAAGADNPLWPGWDVSTTPILFYLPGVQDLLVNHPRPPAGFAAAAGFPAVAGFDVQVKHGPTLIELDGQNTARDVAGVTTLVVADTLSNQRVQMKSRLEAAAASGPLEAAARDVEYDALRTDPYDQMAMIAHEAFHVYQHRRAPAKGANELDVLRYPVLSVVNNVGLALEGEALAAAMLAEFEDEIEEHALRWLAIRHARRAALPAEAIAYEDGNEWNEGLAKYIEYRLFEELEGRHAVTGLEWAQGFHGFDDLSRERAGLIEQIRAQMSGHVNVNNDPYGTAPARMRLYYSGMAIGVLLDRVGVDWHDRILEPGTTLTGLVTEHYDPGDEELAGIWEEIQEQPQVATLRDEKERLRKAGQADNERLVRTILDGPATCLVIDHSALQVPGIAMSFTPFGVRTVDDERIVYTMIPMRARIAAGHEVHQTTAMPLLQEKTAGRLSFQLQEEVSREDLAAALGVESIPGEAIEDVDLELPGATMTFGRAQVEWSEHAIVFRLLP